MTYRSRATPRVFVFRRTPGVWGNPGEPGAFFIGTHAKKLLGAMHHQPDGRGEAGARTPAAAVPASPPNESPAAPSPPMDEPRPAKPAKLSLLLADVDGTLVDSQKRITPRAAAAIAALAAAGIGFAVTSGRPPRGMKMIAEAVRLTAPIAAFNGGTLVRPDSFEVIESLTLPRPLAERVIARLDEHGLDVWVYAGLDWFLRDPRAPHREKEEHTVRFPPTVVGDFSAALAQGVAKVVGVSDDLELIARVERLVQEEFAGTTHVKQSNAPRQHDAADPAAPGVSAARSQPYYLDVTHPQANKGSVVEMLTRTQHFPAGEIATIGDMPNDVLMFERSGFAIAMGQANDQVKSAAARVTAGLDDEGFARAVEDFILGDK